MKRAVIFFAVLTACLLVFWFVDFPELNAAAEEDPVEPAGESVQYDEYGNTVMSDEEYLINLQNVIDAAASPKRSIKKMVSASIGADASADFEGKTRFVAETPWGNFALGWSGSWGASVSAGVNASAADSSGAETGFTSGITAAAVGKYVVEYSSGIQETVVIHVSVTVGGTGSFSVTRSGGGAATSFSGIVEDGTAVVSEGRLKLGTYYKWTETASSGALVSRAVAVVSFKGSSVNALDVRKASSVLTNSQVLSYAFIVNSFSSNDYNLTMSWKNLEATYNWYNSYTHYNNHYPSNTTININNYRDYSDLGFGLAYVDPDLEIDPEIGVDPSFHLDPSLYPDIELKPVLTFDPDIWTAYFENEILPKMKLEYRQVYQYMPEIGATKDSEGEDATQYQLIEDPTNPPATVSGGGSDFTLSPSWLDDSAALDTRHYTMDYDAVASDYFDLERMAVLPEQVAGGTGVLFDIMNTFLMDTGFFPIVLVFVVIMLFIRFLR